MLAAHRDQENVVHQRHVDSKQQPKTPGICYPKTPMKLPLNDENAQAGFAGKSALATKGKGLQQQVFKTPTGTQSRAPLGNKTTNAKARTGQTVGGSKNVLKEFENSQVEPTTVQKNKQSQPKLAPIKFQVKADEKGNDKDCNEPEYAPPNPEPLSYVSDVLPEGGLTFEGLKRENLFKGFYQHFHNPVDRNGVSKNDRELAEEIGEAAQKAAERNDKHLDEIGWNINDMPESMRRKATTSEAVIVTKPGTVQTTRISNKKKPSTITSIKAASSLAIHSDLTRTARKHPATTTTARPLSSMTQRQQPSSKASSHSRTLSVNNIAGEAASRTTIGYSKGRSASSIVHDRGQSTSVRYRRANRTVNLSEDFGEPTLSPARAIAAGGEHAESKPAFMSIFEHESDDEDSPPMRIPPSLLEEDEEAFELECEI